MGGFGLIPRRKIVEFIHLRSTVSYFFSDNLVLKICTWQVPLKSIKQLYLISTNILG
jgi:hypothetical protein